MIERHIFRLRHLRQVMLTLSFFWLCGACAITVGGLSTRPKKADLILVLGNTVDKINRPLPRLEARLEAARSLFQRGGGSIIMVSGGIDPSDGRSEAKGMRDWLIARGIPASRVIVDPLGDNTRASAEHAYEWLANHDLTTVVVVSQYFHLPRARLALRQAGALEVGGDYPSRWFARDFYSTLREAVGYLAYWAQLR